MTDTPQNPLPEIPPAASASIPPVPENPEVPRALARSVPKPAPKNPLARPPITDDRRDFFGDAMREALTPFAGILERKINPILAALEAIPSDIDRFANVTLPSLGNIMDQPQSVHRQLALPVVHDPPPIVRFLRPPGALPPGQFESTCSRCSKCVEVCPANAIRIDNNFLFADGLPYIVPTIQPCVICDSLACMTTCPSGALKLVDRLSIDIGTAKIDYELCRRESGEDCRLCVEACPITGDDNPEAAALFIHAETGRVRIRKNICTGCGLCENRCPTSPPAIQIEPFRPHFDPIIA